MKKKIIALTMAVITMSSSIATFGMNSAYAADEISVVYNGEKLEFDQEPIIEDGRTKVPFRKIFESMGTIVYYNGSKNTIMGLTKTGDIIIHKIGTNTASINGTEQTYDAASTILNGRTLVPVRMISELQGAKVDWNDKTKTVDINKKEESIDSTRKEIMNHVFDINFNPKDVNRYVDYKKKNPNMSTEQVIIDVNLDMDREFVLYTEDYWKPFMGFKHYDSKLEDREEVQNPNDILVVVNNFNTIPDSYEPDDLVNKTPESIAYNDDNDSYLRKEASDYFDIMAKDIEATPEYQNFKFFPSKGYSSIRKANELLFNYRSFAQSGFESENELEENGLEKFAYAFYDEPEMSDLRAGLSFETSVNINELLSTYKNQNGNILYYDYNQVYSFAEKWLEENSFKYGFVERYPLGKKNITKKEYKPWHYRYVGVEAAKVIHDEGLCLEEYVAKYYNPIINDYAYSVDYEGTQRVLGKY